MMIGDRIRQLRKEARMTQPELAEKLNVTRSAVAAYENNTRQPSFHVLVRLAAIFHVTTDYLLVGDTGDSLDINGLSLEQRAIVVNLVNNFKTTNQIIHNSTRLRRNLSIENKELKKQLEENEDNVKGDKE